MTHLSRSTRVCSIFHGCKMTVQSSSCAGEGARYRQKKPLPRDAGTEGTNPRRTRKTATRRALADQRACKHNVSVSPTDYYVYRPPVKETTVHVVVQWRHIDRFSPSLFITADFIRRARPRPRSIILYRHVNRHTENRRIFFFLIRLLVRFSIYIASFIPSNSILPLLFFVNLISTHLRELFRSTAVQSYCFSRYEKIFVPLLTVLNNCNFFKRVSSSGKITRIYKRILINQEICIFSKYAWKILAKSAAKVTKLKSSVCEINNNACRTEFSIHN